MYVMSCNGNNVLMPRKCMFIYKIQLSNLDFSLQAKKKINLKQLN